VTEEGRECSRCKTFKPWSEFSPNPRAKTGYQSSCKLCRNAVYSADTLLNGKPRKQSAEERKVSARKTHLKRKFGITPEEYDWLAALQGYKCALCGEAERLRRREDGRGWVREYDNLGVDHAHECVNHDPSKGCKECIRGLLCDDCNRLLGFAERKVVLAVRFADYLAQRPFREGVR
jgi:hypothetical protein